MLNWFRKKKVSVESQEMNATEKVCDMCTSEYEYISKQVGLTDEELAHIDTNDLYEVALEGQIFYHIIDIFNGDGDFIGIDTNKCVYKITHDPMEIIPLSTNLKDILKDMTRK